MLSDHYPKLLKTTISSGCHGSGAVSDCPSGTCFLPTLGNQSRRRAVFAGYRVRSARRAPRAPGHPKRARGRSRGDTAPAPLRPQPLPSRGHGRDPSPAPVPPPPPGQRGEGGGGSKAAAGERGGTLKLGAERLWRQRTWERSSEARLSRVSCPAEGLERLPRVPPSRAR